MILASKTLTAIDEAITKDQGAAFRQHLQIVLPMIGDAYRGDDDPFRAHLGASLIGKSCARDVWYGFHWSQVNKFDGRMIRLFNRGHLEEGRFIASLLTIGVTIYQQDANGKQFRISDCHGHFGGSGDGVAIGIPDLPEGTACLLEFKTHNDKSFNSLKAQGVRAVKFEHYVQMNVYMRKMGLAVALYAAVNKNDDSYHMELIYLDVDTADRFIKRADDIIFGAAPEQINKSPGWYECKWCNHYGICKKNDLPVRNCRTCEYSTPEPHGVWKCNKHGVQLDNKAQLEGCDAYELSHYFN